MAEKMFDIPTQLVLDKLASKHSFDEAAEEMQKSLDKVGVKIDLKTIRATLEEINSEMLRDIQKIKKANEAADKERTDRYRKMQIELQKLDETNAEHQARLWAVYDKERAKDYAEFLKDAEKGMAEYDKKMNKESLGEVQTMFAKPGGGMEKGGEVLTPRVGEVPIPKGGGKGSEISGMLGAGAAAGAVAGAVMVVGQVLASAIQDMIKQSKIMAMLQDTWNKAMGLLMDLILIPFLPILTYAIIKLFRAIIDFNKWWTTVWQTIKKEGLFGLIKLGIEWLLDQMEKWGIALLRWLFSDETLGTKVVDIAVALSTLVGGIFGYIGDKVIGTILDFIFGEGTYDNAKSAVLNIAMGVIDDILNFLYGIWFAGGQLFWSIDLKAAWDAFLDWVYGLSKDPVAGLTVALHWITGGVADFIAWVYDFITKSKTFTILSQIYDDWVAPIVEWLFNIARNGLRIAVDFVSNAKSIMGFATGGIVPGFPGQPQLAIVHGGEKITPVGRTASTEQGGNTTNYFNFYGLTDSQLQEKIRSTMRKDATRYTL